MDESEVTNTPVPNPTHTHPARDEAILQLVLSGLTTVSIYTHYYILDTNRVVIFILQTKSLNLNKGPFWQFISLENAHIVILFLYVST